MTSIIGAFPDPYPDELLYSVQARYQQRLHDWRVRYTPRELFGSPHLIASTTFPSHLSSLIARLPAQAFGETTPEDSKAIAREFLANHTLLPYYAPFLPPHRLARVEEDLLGAGGPWVQARIGIKASAVPAPPWLRYCPLCVREDRACVGEPYWRREHQAPGVVVCVQHDVWLERSLIRARGQDTRQVYIPASKGLPAHIPYRPLRAGGDRAVLLALSRATHALLTDHVPPPGLDALRAVYQQGLVAEGLALPGGRIYMGRLTAAFLSRYPSPLLRLLQCPLTGQQLHNDHWLARLVRRPRRAQHPLHHLLLQHFLGLDPTATLSRATAAVDASQRGSKEGYLRANLRDSLQDQSDRTTVSLRLNVSSADTGTTPVDHETRRAPPTQTTPAESMLSALEAPFGSGPWPCLNPTCGEYRKPTISQCVVQYPASARGRPLGIFACACGFTYKRLGPDKTTEDRFRRGAIGEYGVLWEQRLHVLWAQGTVSVNTIACKLGVDPLTVKRQACRLGLPLERDRAGRRYALQLSKPLKGPSVYMPSPETRAQQRAAWNQLVSACPGIPVRQLRRRDAGLYMWLYRHDYAWLSGHLPRTESRRRHVPRVNWPARDNDLALAVDQAAKELVQGRACHSTGTKPVRITLSLLGRRIGRLALLQQHLDKFPETTKRLRAVCESWETFAMRRIRWAVASYREEGRIPPRWAFIRRAGIARWMRRPMGAALTIEVAHAFRDLEAELLNRHGVDDVATRP